MLLPLLPHVAVLSLDPEPFVPQGWRVVYVQHLGHGRYQWLATALASARTYAQARKAVRATAARLSAHVAAHGALPAPRQRAHPRALRARLAAALTPALTLHPSPLPHMHPLPCSVAALLAASPVVGFSGSRAPRLASRAALASVLRALPGHVPVVVGCARGIDALVRAARPSALVVQAAGHAPGLLAARSSRLVRHVAGSRACSWPFPPRPAPRASRRRAARPAASRATARVPGRLSRWPLASAARRSSSCRRAYRLPRWLGACSAYGWHLHLPSVRQAALL